MELTSLQKLELSNCNSLESFLEILGKMENIKDFDLVGTSIKELPFSFQNLTRLGTLTLEGRGMLMLPSSILMMPKLFWIAAPGCLLPKQNDKLSSMVSSNILYLQLSRCKLSHEFLPIGLTWFANVKVLDLSMNNFTILPEYIKEFRFLWSINLDYCQHLREISGIPPNLKCLSALHCKSLTSSCRSMLLNQEQHEAGSTEFCLSGTARIPEWFEHQSRGSSISFWFHNQFLSIALFVCNSIYHYSEFHSLRPNRIINGYKYALYDLFNGIYPNIKPDHTYVYDLKLQDRELKCYLHEALLKNEWNHAKIIYEDWMPTSRLRESGIHVFKQKSSIEDIQFTNPYKKRKLDDEDDVLYLQ